MIINYLLKYRKEPDNIFPIEYLPLVEKLFKIRKRRRVSSEHIQKLHLGRDRHYGYELEKVQKEVNIFFNN